MNAKMYVVSGVNGVGKTSVIPGLRKRLDSSLFIVHDFDERGVPDGAGRTWRMNELKQWIEVSKDNAEKNISTVICGFTKIGDFEELNVPNAPEIKLMLLHADSETIRKRLEGRYTKDGIFDENQKVIGKPVTEFIAGNVWYSNMMLEEFEEHDGIVIDTSNISPDEVAEKIVQIVFNYE